MLAFVVSSVTGVMKGIKFLSGMNLKFFLVLALSLIHIYTPVREVPEGFITKTIPAFTWAVFSCRGAMPEALQDVNTKIFSEWLPALKEYEFAAGYCIEYYEDPQKFPKGTMDENYYCEIWIPDVYKRQRFMILRKKQMYRPALFQE